MNPKMRLCRNSCGSDRRGAGRQFVWGLAVMLTASLLHPTPVNSGVAPDDKVYQEKLGSMIIVQSRHDHDLWLRLTQQWTKVSGQIKEFKDGASGRVQQHMGEAIVHAGQRIYAEQVRLRSEIVRLKREAARFTTDEAGQRQEQLGRAVLMAAQRQRQNGDSFQTAFVKEAARLKIVNARRAARTQSELGALIVKEASLPAMAAAHYAEVKEAAARAAIMLDESITDQLVQTLRSLEHELTLRRQPKNYLSLSELVREGLSGPRGVGGFLEYGLAALVGVVIGMIWFGSMAQDVCPTPRSGRPANRHAIGRGWMAPLERSLVR